MKITLCGSTRFHQAFADWAAGLSLAGHTVYSIAMSGKQESDIGKDGNDPITDDEKITLDLVHLSKIEESEVIVVLNVGGYYGDSTRREIQWANMRGKTVYWLENSAGGKFLGYTVWQLDRNDLPDQSIATVRKLKKYASK